MPEEEIERVVTARAQAHAPIEPDVWPENEPYIKAFLVLSPSRQVGFGVGAIPVSEVGAYWDRCGWDDFETFLGRIRAADDEFLKVVRERKGK
jgi:hypothetical protein